MCIWYLVGLVPEEEEKSGRPGDLTPVSGLGRRGAAAQANYRFGILERLRQLRGIRVTCRLQLTLNANTEVIP